MFNYLKTISGNSYVFISSRVLDNQIMFYIRSVSNWFTSLRLITFAITNFQLRKSKEEINARDNRHENRVILSNPTRNFEKARAKKPSFWQTVVIFSDDVFNQGIESIYRKSCSSKRASSTFWFSSTKRKFCAVSSNGTSSTLTYLRQDQRKLLEGWKR